MQYKIRVVAALVLALGFASQASAFEPADALAGTKWKHFDSSVNREIRLEFTTNGLFTFFSTDANGPVTVKGIYSLVGNTLNLKVFENGELKVIEVPLISLDHDRMVTNLQNRERQFSRIQ